MVDYVIYGQYKLDTFGIKCADTESLREAKEKAKHILKTKKEFVSVTIAKATYNKYYDEKLTWVGEFRRTIINGQIDYIWIRYP